MVGTLKKGKNRINSKRGLENVEIQRKINKEKNVAMF